MARYNHTGSDLRTCGCRYCRSGLRTSDGSAHATRIRRSNRHAVRRALRTAVRNGDVAGIDLPTRFAIGYTD